MRTDYLTLCRDKTGTECLYYSIAVSFASDGASGVALVDISAEDSEAAQAGKRAVEKANPKTKCIYIRTDVTKEEEIERAVQRCVEELGRLDYAANFAGILGPLGTTW